MSVFQINPLTSLTQLCYRTLLGALSRPGTLYRTDSSMEPWLRELSSWRMPWPLAVVGYTLMDEQVTVAPCGIEAHAWMEELASATGVRIASLEEADYVLCHSVPDQDAMQAMKQGSLPAPEESATVLVWLNAPIEGDAGVLHISGPGVESSVHLKVSAPMRSLMENRLSIPFEYPMGFDLFAFGSDGSLIGIPRSSNIRIRLDGEG